MIGWWVSKGARKFLVYVLEKNHIEKTISAFIVRMAYIALMVIVLIAVLSELGVQTASLVAVLGAASLAVGLSLKNYLSNFASGILLISSNLFKVGDVVEVDGKVGTVDSIQIFFTNIVTSDNQLVTIPNSSVVTKRIIHYSHFDTRRINLEVGIGYEDDIDHGKSVLLKVMSAHEKVLADPSPMVLVKTLGDSSVVLLVRCWVNRSDYFSTQCDLNELMKKACDKEQINMPYPQTDVHLYKPSAT